MYEFTLFYKCPGKKPALIFRKCMKFFLDPHLAILFPLAKNNFPFRIQQPAGIFFLYGRTITFISYPWESAASWHSSAVVITWVHSAGFFVTMKEALHIHQAPPLPHLTVEAVFVLKKTFFFFSKIQQPSGHFELAKVLNFFIVKPKLCVLIYSSAFSLHSPALTTLLATQ